TGWFWDTLIFEDYTLISTGVYDSFVFKIDQQGNPLWAVQITGTPTSSQYSRSIDIENSGNLYITGRVHETSYFDSLSVTSYGGADVFIAKLHEEPVSIRYNETNTTLDISVYPNPATNYVNINNPALKLNKAEIVSINGNVLRSYNKNLNRLDVSDVPAGICLLRLYSNNCIYIEKIIIH
ncbi:MAG: T9SS type A sorting domain-containing protein, partial [Bacteroidia bacterium]|nr:T9SS type A sorting domain-containing protein [Bacteroidia bacterium]